MTLELGIDIGSTTFKAVLLSDKGKVHHTVYTRTKPMPDAILSCSGECHKCGRCNLGAIGNTIDDFLASAGINKNQVACIVTTGSQIVDGLDKFLKYDSYVSEVSAHVAGAKHYYPDVKCILDVGGQDSKAMLFDEDMKMWMSKMSGICAAGTGSFLHELANKLKINIVGEFQEIALSSKNPINLTERCTVFMESDLMGYAQKGAKIEDLIAGLCYAIVHNYLNRVVGKRYIGNRIMFLGGPSLNKAIVAAFERVLNKEILVPPHREVMGAYGAALLVKENMEKQKNINVKHRDFLKLSNKKIEFKEIICRADPKCSNECKLKIYNFGERKSIWGGDCGRYEATNYTGEKCEDYFSLRQDLYLDVLKKWDIEPGKMDNSGNGPVIGMPFGLHFLEWAFFWGIFFKELGFNVYLTPKTSSEIVKLGIESVVTEMCFPIKVYHGHVRYLKDKCDFYFLPNVIDIPSLSPEEKSVLCPMVAASQYIVKKALSLDERKVLRPHVYLKDDAKHIAFDVVEELKNKLPISYSRALSAIEKAFFEYNEFRNRLYAIGLEVLEKNSNKPIWIITGRPYNLFDFRLNLHLGPRLAKRGILALPMDFIDIKDIDLSDFPRMYWGLGTRILRCAKYIKEGPWLFGVHITNFSCGADSFIEHFYKHILKHKPYLILEFDEHSGVAGMLTRIEAYNNVVHSFIEEMR